MEVTYDYVFKKSPCYSRNIYVLDQYELLNMRSEKFENRMDHYEKDLVDLIKARNSEPKV